MELRQCDQLVELSLENNKLVRPLLDFRLFYPQSFIYLFRICVLFYSYLLICINDRAMAELRVLRLYGNPLEFLPEILPLHKLRHLSLANIRIAADENLRSVNVQIEASLFGQSNMSAFWLNSFELHPIPS